MNIYVGNLPYSVTEKQLTDMFAQFGAVKSAKVITDRATGKSKGFGFVEMENDEEALVGIKELDGKDLEGRRMKVTQARSEGGAPTHSGPRPDFRSRDGHPGARRPFGGSRGGHTGGGSRFGGMR